MGAWSSTFGSVARVRQAFHVISIHFMSLPSLDVFALPCGHDKRTLFQVGRSALIGRMLKHSRLKEARHGRLLETARFLAIVCFLNGNHVQ